MRERYLLKCWLLVLFTAIILVAILPTNLKVEAVFTALLLFLILKTITKKRRGLIIPAIIFSGFYFLSTITPGKLSSISSFAGLGLAFVVALCLVDLKEEAESSE